MSKIAFVILLLLMGCMTPTDPNTIIWHGPVAKAYRYDFDLKSDVRIVGRDENSVVVDVIFWGDLINQDTVDIIGLQPYYALYWSQRLFEIGEPFAGVFGVTGVIEGSPWQGIVQTDTLRKGQRLSHRGIWHGQWDNARGDIWYEVFWNYIRIGQ